MQRTISIKLNVTREQDKVLLELQEAFRNACNIIAPIAAENRCWNRVALHNLVYTKLRSLSPLGSQMICNTIFSVCKAYKNRRILKDETVPLIVFHKGRSIHFDKRTYSIKGDMISLYTLQGRIKVTMRMGPFQQQYFSQGVAKEAELVRRKGKWFFNLVLDVPDVEPIAHTTALGVDLGENTLAALSSGKIFDGGKIRHERDKFLAKRCQLQSNGSQSAKQLLKKISGKEARRMRHINHNVSKDIVKEAIRQQAGVIVLEDLTNIRKRIRAKKRVRTRLNRWAFRDLQMMIEYKAAAKGLKVIYVNPAYTSQTCSRCGQLGDRTGSLFRCSCGSQQHSDLNASHNICRLGLSIGSSTCAVNRTYVAA